MKKEQLTQKEIKSFEKLMKFLIPRLQFACGSKYHCQINISKKGDYYKIGKYLKKVKE